MEGIENSLSTIKIFPLLSSIICAFGYYAQNSVGGELRKLRNRIEEKADATPRLIVECFHFPDFLLPYSPRTLIYLFNNSIQQ